MSYDGLASTTSDSFQIVLSTQFNLQRGIENKNDFSKQEKSEIKSGLICVTQGQY